MHFQKKYANIYLELAQIAQLVEQRTENPRVTGSIPVLGTFKENLYGSLFFVHTDFLIHINY